MALTKKQIARMKIVLMGGEGSGNFSHAGRPGKVGGSQRGRGSVSSNIGKSTAQLGWEKVNSARNKRGYIENSLRDVAKDLGLKTEVSIIDDDTFDDAVEKSVRKIGGFASQVRAVYFTGSDRLWIRGREIEKIQSKGDYRLFLNLASHELGHAWDNAYLRNGPVKEYKSMGEYDNSGAEDFADIFGSRLFGVYAASSGDWTVYGELSRGVDYAKYIEESEALYG